MATSQKNPLKLRLAGAYISSVISISLVLLLIGIASMLIINAKAVADYFKENMRVEVIFKSGVTHAQGIKYEQQIQKSPFVKQTRLVTVEQGTKELENLLGKDFFSVFATNPVPMSIDVTLQPQYVSADSLGTVCRELSRSSLVDEVNCQQSLVESLEDGLARISLVLSVFTALLLFISVVLIANTVRLNIYSHRFTIHTMQLVGATREFIIAPYLASAAIQGLFGSILASIYILIAMFAVRSSFNQIFDLFSAGLLLKVFGIVVLSGVVICLISTLFVVGRITTLSKDELYG